MAAVPGTTGVILPVNGVLLPEANAQIGLAMLAEVIARLTRDGIDSNQSHVQCAFDNAIGAGRTGIGVGHLVEGHATTSRGIGDPLFRNARIKSPDLFSCRGVECKYHVHPRAAVDPVSNFSGVVSSEPNFAGISPV